MIKLQNRNLSVQIDETTGYTHGIYGDDGINWVLTESDWGHIEGFGLPSAVDKTENGVRIEYKYIDNKFPVRAVVEKEITDNRYVERY